MELPIHKYVATTEVSISKILFAHLFPIRASSHLVKYIMIKFIPTLIKLLQDETNG
uniref:AlNc14C67G4742 protein n=1 Tax=Albugo laibachii Nc14 TaxID=890382 RepID=F0WDM2_9STRA|nr:AlNc14C67G4742 [Albugo laibachii Nc14]|eukprot:CCA19297.1 AlNc14C67G4742 [Albugo laibachii Nc14]